jgi:two-component system sensor histidine kinase ChvG
MKAPRLRSFRLRALWVVLGVVLLPQAVVAVASPLHDDALHRELWHVTLGLLPIGLLVGAWLGWRFVTPIEQLRARVADRALGKTTGVDLTLPREDEVGDLSSAFDALVGTLEARAAQNQAFVADLVHELKNPVAAIRAAADALEGRPGDEARAVRVAGVLRDASSKLDAVVSELLELARAEAGMPDEPRERVDLGDLARGLTDAIAGSDRFPGVRWSVDAAGTNDVNGVMSRLDSALRNLIENAASFAGDAGDVTIRVRGEEERVTVEVADSGPGIRDEDVRRVFDRFFTTRGRERGTGLGLALVRAVVEAHGGTVSVLRPEKGAVFRVMLPRRP